jgi:pimeloyl-ACP methyl ester carboxylesterase
MSNNFLLLRGLTREAGHWGDFLTKLQQAYPNAQINTLDLAGSGVFYQHPSPCTIAEITEQLRQRAQESGYLGQKITLLTISLGGMVAWEWMHRYPNDINKAVLINSSLATVNPFYQRLRWQSYTQLARIVYQSDCYQRELAIVKLISNCAQTHEKIAAEWEKIQQLRPVSRQNALRQIIAAARYAPSLEKPTMSLLLLSSLGDRLVSPSCSENISKRWQLPLLTHTWAGHDLCIDDPKWVLEQLRQWL